MIVTGDLSTVDHAEKVHGFRTFLENTEEPADSWGLSLKPTTKQSKPAGIDPAICWPTIRDWRQYMSVRPIRCR